MKTRDEVNVRYMVDDVQASIDFYTKHLGFELRTSRVPAFADVTKGNLRLLLSGPRIPPATSSNFSSPGRATNRRSGVSLE